MKRIDTLQCKHASRPWARARDSTSRGASSFCISPFVKFGIGFRPSRVRGSSHPLRSAVASTSLLVVQHSTRGADPGADPRAPLQHKLSCREGGVERDTCRALLLDIRYHSSDITPPSSKPLAPDPTFASQTWSGLQCQLCTCERHH